MARAVTTIDLTGPFFTRNIKATYSENVHAMFEAMAEEGEQDIKAQVAAAGYAGGHFYEGVKGRVHSLSGKPWAHTAVISQTHVYPWPNAGPKEYRGGRLEARKGFFRKTTNRLRRSRAVNTAELTKGMN